MTAQPTNPLMNGPASQRRGRVTVEMLEEMAASLNRSKFVIGSGKPYFVGKRPNTKDGGIEHFLDRRI